MSLFIYSLVWQEHGVGNIYVFLLKHIKQQNWHSDVTNNCKLTMYRQYKIIWNSNNMCRLICIEVPISFGTFQVCEP